MQKQPQQQIVLYSCTTDEFGHDPFVSEHWLVLIVSGSSELFSQQGIVSNPAGTLGLIRKNQLVKAIKKVGNTHTFSSISICLDQKTLQKFSADYGVVADGTYVGESNVIMDVDQAINNYFTSLMPYFAQPEKLTPTLAQIKTMEVIELLLRKASLKNFLFDFSEPRKLDLEAYMNRHFSYNVPLAQFAKLTGRSLSAFKRDFAVIFRSTPERWLQKKKLEMAYFLIAHKKKKPSDVYLETGFENLSHFSVAFKKEYGINPSVLLKHTNAVTP
ncbi:helix-turn-helix domain-containing protein [Spirosoma rigui]|uniref:helix-turn-helix domain-containing protein n=1 Tax=Spirosoma rigui TaxID=564064 RepID=UPI0009B12458|nr:AraC family transcriptional regulator [Spirosoma rigui]